MPKSGNQKAKLLYLMQILNERTDEAHPMSTNDLIDALAQNGIDAERKSIYSDLETLETFGMDIQKIGGRNAGYYVGSRPFELVELKLLVDAAQVSHFITSKKTNHLISKLENLTSFYQARQLQRQVVVSDRIKSINERSYYTVDELHRAIQDNKQIRFRYFNWEIKDGKLSKELRRGGKEYRVSPLFLTWDDENYYRVAYDEDQQDQRNFRVDKMDTVTITDEERTHFEDLRPADYARKAFGMFGGEEERVELEFANHLAGVIADRFGKDIPVRVSDPGHFIVTVNAIISNPFLSWIFQFGKEVRILSPESVKEKMRELCRSFL